MNGGRVLVETLGHRDDWSVLAIDGRPVLWRSTVRVLRPEVLRMVEQVYGGGEPVRARLPGRPGGDGAPIVVAAEPVFGTGNRVYGVQVRYEPRELPMGLSYSVAAFDYSSDERSIHLVGNPFGWQIPGDRMNWTVPEAFRYVERCDGAMDLILQAIDPADGMRWAGDVTARIGEVSRRYRLALRNGSGAARAHWRGLLLDVTESLAPEPASFDSMALATLGRRHPGPSHLALADVGAARIVRWITDPVPGIQWRGMVDDRDTSHPDDIPPVRVELDRLVREGISTGRFENIRMRRIGGGWTVIDAVSTMLPAPGKPVLLLSEMTVVGYCDDPDPDPAGP